MLYANERKLQKDLEKYNWDIVDHHDYFFSKREVPIGECIPDFILVGISNIPTKIKWPNKWTGKHAFVLWLLKKFSQLTEQEIANLCYEKLERIEPTINDLISSRLVDLQESGKITLNTDFLSIRSEVIAIEAKISRWKEAFEQAKRYQLFANKVIVAMDADEIPRKTEIIEKFQKQCIGLCAVSPQKIEWLVLPTTSIINGYEKEYIVTSILDPSRQRFWSRRNFLNACCQERM